MSLSHHFGESYWRSVIEEIYGGATCASDISLMNLVTAKHGVAQFL
jgi:hypothetical protein